MSEWWPWENEDALKTDGEQDAAAVEAAEAAPEALEVPELVPEVEADFKVDLGSAPVPRTTWSPIAGDADETEPFSVVFLGDADDDPEAESEEDRLSRERRRGRSWWPWRRTTRPVAARAAEEPAPDADADEDIWDVEAVEDESDASDDTEYLIETPEPPVAAPDVEGAVARADAFDGDADDEYEFESLTESDPAFADVEEEPEPDEAVEYTLGEVLARPLRRIRDLWPWAGRTGRSDRSVEPTLEEEVVEETVVVPDWRAFPELDRADAPNDGLDEDPDAGDEPADEPEDEPVDAGPDLVVPADDADDGQLNLLDDVAESAPGEEPEGFAEEPFVEPALPADEEVPEAVVVAPTLFDVPVVFEDRHAAEPVAELEPDVEPAPAPDSDEDADEDSGRRRGYRTLRRWRKRGRLGRIAAAKPAPEPMPRFAAAVVRVLRAVALVLLGAVVLLAALYGLGLGVNAFARWNARRVAALNATPVTNSLNNVLIIGVREGQAIGFAALKAERANKRVLGIAIPDGAFVEVPGQGFERLADSYVQGPDVSRDAVSNYLGVKFGSYVVVSGDAYQALLKNQDVAGVMAQIQATDLSAADQADLTKYFASVRTADVWIVPLPVKPISVGDQQYFEPQRQQVADLLLQWWDVKIDQQQAAPRVVVYNGVGTPGIAGKAAQQLIRKGFRVVDSGNADNFKHKTTLILLYHGTQTEAGNVRSTLGVGQIMVQSAPQDLADMIVIIGADYRPPADVTEVTSTP